mgnify:FL=1
MKSRGDQSLPTEKSAPYDPTLQMPNLGHLPTPPSSLGTISSEKHIWVTEDGTEYVFSWNKSLGKQTFTKKEPKTNIRSGEYKKDKGQKIKKLAKDVAEVIGTGVGAYDKARR